MMWTKLTCIIKGHKFLWKFLWSVRIGTFFCKVRNICYPGFLIAARLSQLLWWETTYVSHPPEKNVPNLTRSKKLQRELTPFNYITIPCCVWCTFPNGWSQAGKGDSKTSELVVLWKRCPDFQCVFTPFFTSDIYDSYMDIYQQPIHLIQM